MSERVPNRGGIVNDRKINDGITGPVRYDTEFIEFLKQIREGLEEVYPVSIKIDVANTTDKRWGNWRNGGYETKET
jgi:hypothetical protein